MASCVLVWVRLMHYSSSQCVSIVSTGGDGDRVMIWLAHSFDLTTYFPTCLEVHLDPVLIQVTRVTHSAVFKKLEEKTRRKLK